MRPSAEFAQNRLQWKSTLPASCGERKCYRRCPLIAEYTGSAEGGRQRARGEEEVEEEEEGDQADYTTGATTKGPDGALCLIPIYSFLDF